MTTTRARRWPGRGRTVDLVLVAVVVAVASIVPTFIEAAREPGGSVSWFSWIMLLAASGSLLLRRRFPVTVAAFTLVCCVVYYINSEVDGPILLTFVVALYTVAAYRHALYAAGLAVLALLAALYGELNDPGTRHVDNLTLFMMAGWLVAVVAIGGVVNNRMAYLVEADKRALAAERGREDEAVRRATEERLRIARELHDSLGHNVSLINVQASAALHRDDPVQARQALAAIKDTSKQALRELRHTLGVLRQVDELAPTAPPPSLRRLPELVSNAAELGVSVRTEVDGEPRELPSDVDHAAYRIVQEALTNVARHAGTDAAVVRVSYGWNDVRVEIDDDGSGPGSDGSDPGGSGASGIVGMTERARALGGSLSAGGKDGGGFRVRAVLPLDGAT